MKANGHSPTNPNGGYSAGWARRSLNILKSLHHPRTLPHIDDDSDEEMEIDEDAVEKLCNHVDMQLAGIEGSHKITEERSQTVKSERQLVVSGDGSLAETKCNMLETSIIEDQGAEDTDVNMEECISEQVQNHENETMIVDGAEPVTNSSDFGNDIALQHNIIDQNGKENINQLIVDTDSSRQISEEKKILCSSDSELVDVESVSKAMGNDASCPVSDSLPGVSTDVSVANIPSESGNGSGNCASPSTLSIVTSNVSPVLKSPTPSVSPRISESRKSLRTSSMLTASQKDLTVDSNLGPEAAHMSFTKSSKSGLENAISTQTRKNFRATTEHLAASLHRGLEIIDSHRQSSAFRRSSFRFSVRPAEFKQVLPVEKVDVGVQTSQNDKISEEDPVLFLCSNCKNIRQPDVQEENDSSNLQLVPVDGSESADKSKKQVPKVSMMASAGFWSTLTVLD